MFWVVMLAVSVVGLGWLAVRVRRKRGPAAGD